MPTEQSKTAQGTLPPFFPRVAKECRQESKEFFDCFTSESKHEIGGDPAVGQQALSKCSQLLEAYKSCSEKYLQHRPLVSAPQSYVEQTKK